MFVGWWRKSMFNTDIDLVLPNLPRALVVAPDAFEKYLVKLPDEPFRKRIAIFNKLLPCFQRGLIIENFAPSISRIL